jgi:hypothetical protein
MSSLHSLPPQRPSVQFFSCIAAQPPLDSTHSWFKNFVLAAFPGRAVLANADSPVGTDSVRFRSDIELNAGEVDEGTFRHWRTDGMRQRIGFVLQILVLMFLPLVIGWQLFFGFPLLAMPAATIAAIAVFSLGHALRQS